MRELLQHRKQGLQDVVIDPDGEYRTLCLALGGDYLRVAPGSEQHLNPFDLLPQGTDMREYVADRSRGVGPRYLVDAQRTPFRSRTTGFLGVVILCRDLVQGRPLFL